MDDRIRKFREGLAHHRTKHPGGGARYPSKLRALGIEICRDQIAAGVPVPAIASALQINYDTLRYWLSHSNLLKPSPRFRPVALADGPSSSDSAADRSLRLMTPEGIRIEGLDVAGVIRILEALR